MSLVDKVKSAGIVGAGGATFPTHVKIDATADVVIVNGAECEPYLTSDYRLMIERSSQIIEGLKIVLRLFPHAKGIIAIENNKPEAIRTFIQKCALEDNIEIKTVYTKYPQGGERYLIFATTRRKIYSKMLPADAGCIVDNVATMAAIYQAVIFDHPLVSTIMTLTGDAMKEPCNLEVPIGTNLQYLVDQNGGFKKLPEKIISGGPMMGTALMSLDIPAVKTSSSILALSNDEVANSQETACIHCGRCLDVCPSNIAPSLMYQSAMKNDIERFIKLNGRECIECGCCSYICPAKRNMTQSFKKMKRLVIASRKK